MGHVVPDIKVGPASGPAAVVPIRHLSKRVVGPPAGVVSAAEPVAGAVEPKRARLRGKQPAPAAYVRLPAADKTSILVRAGASRAEAAGDAAVIASQASAVEGGAYHSGVDQGALSRCFHQFYRCW
jgi:hypothetical protein